jgi:hypothetical protein
MQVGACVQALVSEQQLAALRACTAAGVRTMAPEHIDDVLRRAATPGAAAAEQPPQSLQGAEQSLQQSMQLLAAAQVTRRRHIATLMLMSLHIMTILSPQQLARW